MYNSQQQGTPLDVLKNIHRELTGNESFISLIDSLPYITFIVTLASQVIAYNRQSAYAVSRNRADGNSFESTGEFIKCVHGNGECSRSRNCVDCPLIKSMEASNRLDNTVVNKDVLLYLKKSNESITSVRCTLISTPFTIADTRLILITLLDSDSEESKNMLEEQFARELLRNIEVTDDLEVDFAASVAHHIEAIHESILSY